MRFQTWSLEGSTSKTTFVFPSASESWGATPVAISIVESWSRAPEDGLETVDTTSSEAFSYPPMARNKGVIGPKGLMQDDKSTLEKHTVEQLTYSNSC